MDYFGLWELQTLTALSYRDTTDLITEFDPPEFEILTSLSFLLEKAPVLNTL